MLPPQKKFLISNPNQLLIINILCYLQQFKYTCFLGQKLTLWTNDRAAHAHMFLKLGGYWQYLQVMTNLLLSLPADNIGPPTRSACTFYQQVAPPLTKKKQEDPGYYQYY